eukprot:GDKJ01024730.1.p1 GENE.GDKJ01024730.1~~GDKJ01024730.1.p1  ORF type:complete len:826 (-),score=244.08 GDKJ01024730.1:49-2262(-)
MTMSASLPVVVSSSQIATPTSEPAITVRHPEKHSLYLSDNLDEETESALFEEGDPLESRILDLLIQRGARVLVDYKLVDVQEESLLFGGGAHGGKNNGMLSMLVGGGGALGSGQMLGGGGNSASNGGGGKLKRIILEDYTTLPDAAEAMWKKREESIQIATQAALNEQNNNNNRGGAMGALGGGSSNLPSLNPNAASNQEAAANANSIREPFPGFDHPRLRARRRSLKNKEEEQSLISGVNGAVSGRSKGATRDAQKIPELEDLMDLSSWSPVTGRLHKRLLSRALICAGRRGVDPVIFEAAHGAGIVYDGRLVVDAHFQTADSNIYAGGSLCRFSNKYRLRPDQCLRLDHYNGREVGACMAHQVLKNLDPIFGSAPCPKYADHRWIREVGAAGRDYLTEATSASSLQAVAQGTVMKRKRRASEANNHATHVVNGTSTAGRTRFGEPIIEGALQNPPETAAAGRMDPKNADDGLYLFSQPIISYAVLPGGLHYITGRICASQANMEALEIEEVLETDCVKPYPKKKGENAAQRKSALEGHLTRLEILKDGRLGRFSILGHEPIAPEAVEAIVGMPATLLNHLRTRVKEGDVKDILEFLSDEWSTALWFDSFADFFSEVKKDIIADENCRKQIADLVRNLNLKRDEAVGLDRLQDCITKLTLSADKKKETDLKKKMDSHLINFLRRIQPHLKWHQTAAGGNQGGSSGLVGNSNFHQQAMGSVYFLPEEWSDAWKTLHM